ncbi:MAG: hypothetical protein Q9M50_08240 [Methylococcales bacterium]|nr:hypothetical protein [Methylococcales bacterium]
MSNSSYGNGWKCNWGYHKADNHCVIIKIPENAYLNSFGNGWACQRKFKALDQRCVAVKIPANGYFFESPYGSGWKCERGYLAQNKACIPLKVPANAHIDYSGADWGCNPPYIKKLDQCERPISND